MRLFAADLWTSGELRVELSDDEVADVIWSINALLLVHERGRTPERFGEWPIDAWCRVLAEP